MSWKCAANLQKNTHRLCNFIEITHRHGCSPVNLLHIFRTPFLKNTSGQLLLIFVQWATLYYKIFQCGQTHFNRILQDLLQDFESVSDHFETLSIRVVTLTLHKKWSFPLWISSVNVLKKSLTENFIFCAVWILISIFYTALQERSRYILNIFLWNSLCERLIDKPMTIPCRWCLSIPSEKIRLPDVVSDLRLVICVVSDLWLVTCAWKTMVPGLSATASYLQMVSSLH